MVTVNEMNLKLNDMLRTYKADMLLQCISLLYCMTIKGSCRKIFVKLFFKASRVLVTLLLSTL